ncbi:MAG: carbon-nitrogen hydrolase family protein [Euryarchaeota archaeon]|nr:carbon-nitrogen hydrolase family protein [Euryarchaeota archaeon]
MRVSVPQVPARLGDKGRNIDAIERFAKGGADIIIFPEIFLSGYVIKDELRLEAEPLDGPSCRRISQIAKKRKKVIVWGMVEKDAKKRGVLYNSAVIALPDGSVRSYRKLYLANFGPFEERTYFAPGKELVVVDTPFGRIGLTICFDIYFPELARALALMGAEIIVNISASPASTRPFFEKVLPARAIENTVFVAYSNQVGTQRDEIFWGGNCVIDPRGSVVAKGKEYEDCKVEAEISLDDLETARHYRPTIREARPEVLEALARALR